eukprot:CFRG3614T1
MLSADTLLKSAYELAREERISQNQAFLTHLGLENEVRINSKSKRKLVRDRKSKKIKKGSESEGSNYESESEGGSEVDDKNTPKRRKIKKENINAPRAPSRRSRRLQHIPVEVHDLGNEDIKLAGGRAERREETQAQALAKYDKLLEKHKAAGLKLPATATYGHTLYRVRTMSEEALERRVRVIESAEGNYAVIKMQMFAEVLILEGYEKVAQEAKEALDRLLERPKFKGKDWEQMMNIAMGFKCK